MAAFAKYEDSVLRKVLAVTLQASDADPAASPPVVHLAGLEKVRAKRSCARMGVQARVIAAAAACSDGASLATHV